MYKYKIYFDDSGIPNRMFEEKPLEEQMYIFMEILATDFDVPLDDSIADIFSIAEDIITHFLLLDYEKTLNLVKACEVKLLMFLSEFLYDIFEACPKQELITVFEDSHVGMFSAKKAGFTTVGVYDAYSYDDALKREADYYITDFRGLKIA